MEVAIAASQKVHPELPVHVIENTVRTFLSEVNAAIRTDAYSCPYPDCVERCLSVPKSIAVMYSLGMGDAGCCIGAQAPEVDTMSFGAFRFLLLDKVGFYDETLLLNQDFKFNTRICQNGGRIWLVPQIATVYHAHSTLVLELAIYIIALFLAGVLSSLKHRNPYLLIGLPLSIATMQLAWGGGFLWSVLISLLDNPQRG